MVCSCNINREANGYEACFDSRDQALLPAFQEHYNHRYVGG